MKTISQASNCPSLAHSSAGADGALTMQGGVSSGQISLFPKQKQWCGILQHCMLNIFPRGTLGAYRAYFSGPQLKKKKKQTLALPRILRKLKSEDSSSLHFFK